MNAKQGARYVISGFVSNATLLLIFWVLQNFGIDSLLAVAATYVLGIGISLMLNGRWTFGSLTKQNFWPITTRFVFLYLLGLGYSLLAFQVIATLGLPNLVTQVFVMGSCAILLFLGQKYWVFKTHKQVEEK